MTTTTRPRPQIDPVDVPEPPLFEEEPSKPARRPVDMTIHATVNGWHIEFALSLPVEQIPATLKRLEAIGATPLAPPSITTAQKPPRPRAKEFTGDGEPICPIHGVPMKEGNFGWYCGKKASSPETSDKKGYCSAVYRD